MYFDRGWATTSFYHIFNIKQPCPLKDIDVIARIINKDKNALYLLYDKYSAALFGVILRICENRSLAEDVLQETFVKIWNKMPSYDPEKGRFYTWAYRIAKNTALNAIRNTQPLIQEEDLSVLKVVETSNETHDIEKLNGLLANPRSKALGSRLPNSPRWLCTLNPKP